MTGSARNLPQYCLWWYESSGEISRDIWNYSRRFRICNHLF